MVEALLVGRRRWALARRRQQVRVSVNLAGAVLESSAQARGASDTGEALADFSTCRSRGARHHNRNPQGSRHLLCPTAPFAALAPSHEVKAQFWSHLLGSKLLEGEVWV
jgi:hypothetical protein